MDGARCGGLAGLACMSRHLRPYRIFSCHSLEGRISSTRQPWLGPPSLQVCTARSNQARCSAMCAASLACFRQSSRRPRLHRNQQALTLLCTRHTLPPPRQLLEHPFGAIDQRYPFSYHPVSSGSCCAAPCSPLLLCPPPALLFMLPLSAGTCGPAAHCASVGHGRHDHSLFFLVPHWFNIRPVLTIEQTDALKTLEGRSNTE